MNIFFEPARVVLLNIGNILPKLFVAVVAAILGWLISGLLNKILNKFLKLIKLDKLADNLGINTFLVKGGIKYTFCELISVCVYWLGLLITVVIVMDVVGLSMAAFVFERVINYIPNIIAALFILILGIFAANLLGATATAALTNAGVNQARILGKIAEIVIIIFSVSAFLEQLGIAKATVLFAVSIIFASLGFAFALAFGLGGKDIAAKFLDDFLEKLKSKVKQ